MSPTFDVTMPRLLISSERETEQAERRSQVRVVRLDYGGRRRGERARSIGCGLEDRPVEELVAESRPIADARECSSIVALLVHEARHVLREHARCSESDRCRVDLVEPVANRARRKRGPERGERARIADVDEPSLNRCLAKHALVEPRSRYGRGRPGVAFD